MSAFKNNSGFTIIEFMVSVVILTAGLLGLLQAINLAISTNMTNMMRNEATVLADETLSARMALLSPSDAAPFATYSASASVPRKIFNGTKVFAVKTMQKPISDSVEVNVTVNWSHKNTAYTHNASTVLSKR